MTSYVPESGTLVTANAINSPIEMHGDASELACQSFLHSLALYYVETRLIYLRRSAQHHILSKSRLSTSLLEKNHKEQPKFGERQLERL